MKILATIILFFWKVTPEEEERWSRWLEQ